MDSEALKPCPFCGGMGQIIDEYARWFTFCADCFCSVGQRFDGYGEPNHMFETKAEAIAAWNTRANADYVQLREDIRQYHRRQNDDRD